MGEGKGGHQSEKVRLTDRASGTGECEVQRMGWLSFLEHHSDVTKTNVSLIYTILHWPSCPWGKWTNTFAGS